MLDWINSFTVLIQTICAVNFVFIVSHYPRRVFGIIFNENQLVKKKFNDNTDQIVADVQSLEAMDVMTLQDGRNTQQKLDSLKKDYDSLKKEWDSELEEIKALILRAKTVKGSKCLFLSISLFCLLTLLNISLLTLYPCDFCFIFTVTLNILTLVYSVYLTIVMWRNKWGNRGAVDCYKQSIKDYLIIVFSALLIAGLNFVLSLGLGITPASKPLANSLLSLCVFLPFYPCLMVVVYVYCYERIITWKTNKETQPLLLKQKGLHNRKLELDNIEKSFTLPPSFH